MLKYVNRTKYLKLKLSVSKLAMLRIVRDVEEHIYRRQGSRIEPFKEGKHTEFN